MAQPADISLLREAQRVGAASVDTIMAAEHNKLVDNLRTLCAKLDADAGVTDTNYAALVTAADAASAAKIVLTA